MCPGYRPGTTSRGAAIAAVADSERCLDFITVGEAGAQTHVEVDEVGGTPDALTTEERQELVRLRRELKQVRMERNILKKATAFFAKESS